MSDQPQYESIRRTGGESSEANPPKPDEPQYESIRRTGGGKDDDEAEEADEGEAESGGGAG
jgi:hypothetical protein